jgi:hypothetical protein
MIGTLSQARAAYITLAHWMRDLLLLIDSFTPLKRESLTKSRKIFINLIDLGNTRRQHPA